jgi:hypothetical protein
MVVRPAFPQPEANSQHAQVFVLMPFAETMNPVYEDHIKESDSASLAGFYTKSGRRAEAEKLLDKWKRRSSRELGYEEAMADQAFRWLEQAYQEHSCLSERSRLIPARTSILVIACVLPKESC